MITGNRHTGLVVRNLEKSRFFYENLLGFRLWKQALESGSFIETVVGIPGVILEWVKLKAPDDSVLELLQYHSHPVNDLDSGFDTVTKLGLSHLALTVKNIDEAYLLLLKHEIHCNSAPQRSPDGKVKVLYCHDPDGIIVELVEECRNSPESL